MKLGIPNREFLMLGHLWDEEQLDFVWDRYYVSEKLDGIRCFWDGGWSRGRACGEVPWSTERDHRMVATGLWTRYGKVIVAPSWWVKGLAEGVFLDGELYMGRGKWEQTSSIVRTRNGEDKGWDDVEFCVFDSPPVSKILQRGRINNSVVKDHIIDCDIQALNLLGLRNPLAGGGEAFAYVYDRLRQRRRDLGVRVSLVEQRMLTDDRDLKIWLEDVVNNGGEGLMLRERWSHWEPKRVRSLLKIKAVREGEGTVVGWKKGTGRLAGMLGSYRLEWNGKVFDIAGLSDEQRRLNDGTPKVGVGAKVKFLFRELSSDGIPKEARLKL